GEGDEGRKRPSWREFLEACYQLAKEQTYSRSRPVTAFDVHVSASQALSCLIFEVWASEIYEGGEEGRARLKEQVALRRWEHEPKAEGLIRTQAGTPRPPQREARWLEAAGVIQWLQKYRLDLFKPRLHLIEVLDIEGLP